MATNYLSLTNELIRELNEVALTASTFTNAKGIQQHIKDSVNKAYLDIVLEEPKGPFLSTAISGTTNPMYGNVVVGADDAQVRRALGVDLELVRRGEGRGGVGHVGAAHAPALGAGLGVVRHGVEVGGARACAAVDDALGDADQGGVQ